jgi:S-formylglutathione hydrolase FrmB
MKAFRVLPPGEHWAIGGLSDGGFCAANLALRHPGRFGAVASMDGFYSTSGDLPVLGRIFGWNSTQLRNNDPQELAADARRTLPRFWLMSGTGNSIDTQAASQFSRVLTSREPIATVIVHGGKHTPSAWRVVLPTLLQWSWNTLSGGQVGCATTSVWMSQTPSPSPPASPAPTAPVVSSTAPVQLPPGPSPSRSPTAAPRT